MIARAKIKIAVSADGVREAADLGLIQKIPQLRIANRIYREIIPREWNKSQAKDSPIRGKPLGEKNVLRQ